MAPFHELDGHALHGIAAGLRRGILEPPTPATLRPHCPPELLEDVAELLQRFAQRGFTADQLADMLDLLAEDRSRIQRQEPKLDLVWTGPDPERFVDRDAAVVVLDLFQTVERSLILSSFVIYNGSELFAPLHKRMTLKPGLDVKLFVDIQRPPEDPRPAEVIVNDFKAEFVVKHWPWVRKPEVYYDPRSLSRDKASQASLHAKVVVADEQTTLITSANLTPKAQNKNIEAGIRIDSPAFARTVSLQFLGLVEQGLVRKIGF